jgi:hypothetical protein
MLLALSFAFLLLASAAVAVVEHQTTVAPPKGVAMASGSRRTPAPAHGRDCLTERGTRGRDFIWSNENGTTNVQS